ncbi:putative tannase subunit protein [Phaeoacremonium minimum UCRPA7]|uniref:Carboxylic ester hydrolase n=1 Tax=Phaeoacremonium minimum (strain UCR-PA7) TaxID=1286976 RepID=R8BND2_PHAM7|nr:putative tannase subunit protein [Phaeoacremonium minimum UCRPA7]EOO00913.1 putative tannase subunit protein [Phaeoacremonium minimum UCRPA7]
MPRYSRATIAALATTATAASLSDLCTVTNVQAALPANGTLLGIDLVPSTVTASAVYNATTGGGMMGGGSTTSYTYCNVTVTYTHTGKGDEVVVKYAFPSPSDFQNRFYVAGGGGFSLSTDATGGLAYGAAGGATDAGYDAFDNSYDEVVLYGNGSINWDATYMFGYQALGEMTLVGKAITKGLYGLSSESKVYTYYEGCSDGGREGMSQVQRWGEEYDGVIAGAPAFRFAQQQVLHVYSSAVEHTLDYYPPPCELDKIVNATIAACDPLDGRTDGVVSRTDLCKLNFNLTSIIGEPYYCAAENSTSLGFGFSKRQAEGSTTSYQPAQNGTVSAEGIAVAQAIYDGVFNSQGQRAYLSWQIASELGDAATVYNSDTGAWELSIPSTGGEYVTKFVQLLDLDNLDNLDNVTYDTLVDWMNTGMIRYLDSLQTTLPDLTPFQSSGGKLLHYHGESDPSIPSASSVHYWQSVRSIMYGNLTDEESLSALEDWYQFYLIPGAAHCGTNSLQPGPYPQNNMDIMIDWVENGVKPTRLNTTVSSGTYAGETQMLCQWPTRPLWQGNSSSFDCVNDEASIESWTYTFPAFKLPVY